MQIIDADGHVNDRACGDEIAKYMPRGNQLSLIFPELDHLHFRFLKLNRRETGNPSSCACIFSLFLVSFGGS